MLFREIFRYKDDFSSQYNRHGEVRKIQVDLRGESPPKVTPTTTRRASKKETNLKYFTSRIHELPGPITQEMKSVHDARSKQQINKRYDNNLRKVLYQSSYQTVNLLFLIKQADNVKKVEPPKTHGSYRKEISFEYNPKVKHKYENEGRKRDFYCGNNVINA